MKYALFLVMLVAGGISRADIPPSDDYVETCTIEKQAVPGLTCESCRAWHGERDACDKTLGTQGFRKMCKGWGASAWSEVWCKGEASEVKSAEGPTPTHGPESKKTGCNGAGLEFWALAGLVLPLARRRR